MESKSILEIAQELKRLKESGSKGAFTPFDLSNGTITLSNIGSIGGTVLHPVLVQGQVCIGGIGRVQRVPRFSSDGESIESVDIVHVSFNADHRVIDGATMARFVGTWRDYLENPHLLTLNTR